MLKSLHAFLLIQTTLATTVVARTAKKVSQPLENLFNMFFKKKKEWPSTSQKRKTRFFLLASSENVLANHPSRNSPVIIVNVKLCRDAFKDRFREGVCTYFGGGCKSEFLLPHVLSVCCVKSLYCEYDKCI